MEHGGENANSYFFMVPNYILGMRGNSIFRKALLCLRASEDLFGRFFVYAFE